MRLHTLIALLGISLFIVGCAEKVEPVKSVTLHRFTEDIVLSAALSKDSSKVALLNSDHQVTLWDNRSKKLLHRWDKKQFTGELTHISLSGDSNKLGVAGHWTVYMLDAVNGSFINSFDVKGFNSGATVSALHLGLSGQKVLIGMSDGAILSVDLKTGSALKLDHHENQITRLIYTPDKQFAVSGSTDKNFALWRTDNGEVVFQHNFRSRITAVAFDQSSNRVFASDALNTHWLVDGTSGEKMGELEYFERFRYFRQALFVQQGKLLITSSPKETMTLWDVSSGEEKRSWSISRYRANATVIDMTENAQGQLVTLSSDGVVETWNYRAL